LKASKEEIAAFLRKFKEVVTSSGNNNLTIIQRNDYKDTVSYLGITYKQAREEILGLTFENYIDGPKQDHKKKNNNIWEFGIKIYGEEIYIKLSDDFSEGRAFCISFHIPKYSLKWPYKNS